MLFKLATRNFKTCRTIATGKSVLGGLTSRLDASANEEDIFGPTKPRSSLPELSDGQIKTALMSGIKGRDIFGVELLKMVSEGVHRLENLDWELTSRNSDLTIALLHIFGALDALTCNLSNDEASFQGVSTYNPERYKEDFAMAYNALRATSIECLVNGKPAAFTPSLLWACCKHRGITAVSTKTIDGVLNLVVGDVSFPKHALDAFARAAKHVVEIAPYRRV